MVTLSLNRGVHRVHIEFEHHSIFNPNISTSPRSLDTTCPGSPASHRFRVYEAVRAPNQQRDSRDTYGSQLWPLSLAVGLPRKYVDHLQVTCFVWK